MAEGGGEVVAEEEEERYMIERVKGGCSIFIERG